MSKEFLLGLSFRSEKIKIEGQEFVVKEMTAKTAEVYESSLYNIVGKSIKYDASKAKTKLVMLTLYEADGVKRVFEDKDYELVTTLPAHIVDQVFEVASNLNNLDAEQVEKN